MDPYFPLYFVFPEFGGVYFPDKVAKVNNITDQCFSRPHEHGLYHYHLASPCITADSPLILTDDDKYEDVDGNSIVNPTQEELDRYKTETFEGRDVLADFKKASKKERFRKAIGLAKDGRPIYGPYYGDLKVNDDCDVDVCNGRFIGNHYSYVSTFFHPYVMGCFGPGDSPNLPNPLKQRCSRNPRLCNI